jgi:hypothetical protein
MGVLNRLIMGLEFLVVWGLFVGFWGVLWAFLNGFLEALFCDFSLKILWYQAPPFYSFIRKQ